MVVFEPAARSILILEDDNLILRVLVELARRVGRNLRKEGLPIDLTILSAQTLDQAYQIIEEYGKHISDKYARLFIRNLRSMVKNGESKDSIEAINELFEL